MQAMIVKEVEVDIKLLLIELYITDLGTGSFCVPKDFPLLCGHQWSVYVCVGTGRIFGWPDVGARRLRTQIRSYGSYTIFDDKGSVAGRICNWFVPCCLMTLHSSEHLDLDIGADGVIKNWPKSPHFNDFFPDYKVKS